MLGGMLYLSSFESKAKALAVYRDLLDKKRHPKNMGDRIIELTAENKQLKELVGKWEKAARAGNDALWEIDVEKKELKEELEKVRQEAQRDVEKARKEGYDEAAQFHDLNGYSRGRADAQEEIDTLEGRLSEAAKIRAEFDEWLHKKCWQSWIIADRWKETNERLRGVLSPPTPTAESPDKKMEETKKPKECSCNMCKDGYS